MRSAVSIYPKRHFFLDTLNALLYNIGVSKGDTIMDMDEILTRFNEYWGMMPRPMTAIEVAYMFVDDYPDVGYDADEIATAWHDA